MPDNSPYLPMFQKVSAKHPLIQEFNHVKRVFIKTNISVTFVL